MRVDVSVFRVSDIPDSSLDHYCQYVTRLRQPSLRRVLSAERKPEGIVLVCPALPEGWNWVDHLALPLTIDEACSVAYSLARAFDYLHVVGFRGGLQISPSEQFAFYKDPAGLQLTVFPPEPRYVFLRHSDTAACGTPAYMPPEFGQATPASDSYGLAALLYLLLTGETMIAKDRDIQETVSRVVHAAFVRLGDRRLDLPQALVDFVDRATRRDPAERPGLKEWAERMRDLGGHLLPQPCAVDKGGESDSTVNQAAVLAARGNVTGAWDLLKRQERTCRKLGNQDGLQRALSQQALILRARGDLDTAMALYQEQERICRELGDNEGLLSCLRRQSEIHSSRGDEFHARGLLGAVERIERERRSRGALTITHALGRGAFGDTFQGEYRVPAVPRAMASEADADPGAPVETRPLDTVCFSVTAPRAIAPERSCVIDAWIHLRESVEDVLAMARDNQQFADVDIRTKVGVRLRRGSLLTARLRIDGLVIDDPEDEVPWNGETANASFLVRVPREAATGDYPGQCTFHFDGMRIAKVPFVLRVGDAAKDVAVVTTEGQRSAFASYSRKDSTEVFARIQGLMKALPQLDIFIDVASLRSGDRWQEKLDEAIAKRDTFYLFWSKNASESPYVEREWRHALAVKGLDAIEPVPMVSPLEVPPPAELAEKHFDDWVLSFMRARD